MTSLANRPFVSHPRAAPDEAGDELVVELMDRGHHILADPNRLARVARLRPSD